MIPQYQPDYNRRFIAKEVCKYILGKDNYFSEHIKTKEFESKLASFLNVKHCVTVNNGTIALSLSLLAQGVKAGDYVLVPEITMMSTQSAVELIGAKPVFVDVDSNGCMNLDIAEDYVKSNSVSAVIYVSLNGRKHLMSDYYDFNYLCDQQGIALIEDNCQSFASKDSNNSYISCSKNGIGCFSLSFHKLLSTGQGGFCVTNDDSLAKKLRELKNVGRTDGGNDIHEEFGINSKFTDIQAIIGLCGLEEIEHKKVNKKRVFETYRNELKDVKEINFIDTNSEQTCAWFVDIYIDKRDELQEFLKTNGIQTRKVYPELSSQKINEKWKERLNVNAKNIAKTGLWLPSSLTLTEEDIKHVCGTIKTFFNHENTLKDMGAEQ